MQQGHLLPILSSWEHRQLLHHGLLTGRLPRSQLTLHLEALPPVNAPDLARSPRQTNIIRICKDVQLLRGKVGFKRRGILCLYKNMKGDSLEKKQVLTEGGSLSRG